MLEKDSKCLALEESSGDVAHLNNRIKKLQKELESTTELQVEKMTLEIRVHELEERLNGAGDGASATPKSDRKLNKVYGLFGKFYGKDKQGNPGESNMVTLIHLCINPVCRDCRTDLNIISRHDFTGETLNLNK